MRPEYSIRPWTLSDLESLVKFANNPKIAGNMTDKFPHPYTEKDGTAFINFANGEGLQKIFAIEVNGEAVGGIGLHPMEDIHRNNGELGYWVGEPFWNQGIVTDAITSMLDYGFRELDVNRIFARPFGWNKASQRVLEKVGFKLEARFENTLFKNGQFTDELVYALRSAEWKPLKEHH